MRTVGEAARDFLEKRRRRHARLPWRELEAEAARQGCSPADIFFDRAGRIVGLPVAPEMDDPLNRGASLRRRATKAELERGKK